MITSPAAQTTEATVQPFGMGQIKTWQAVDETLRGRFAFETVSDTHGDVVTITAIPGFSFLADIEWAIDAARIFEIIFASGEMLTVRVLPGTTWRAVEAAVPPLD